MKVGNEKSVIFENGMVVRGSFYKSVLENFSLHIHRTNQKNETSSTYYPHRFQQRHQRQPTKFEWIQRRQLQYVRRSRVTLEGRPISRSGRRSRRRSGSGICAKHRGNSQKLSTGGRANTAELLRRIGRAGRTLQASGKCSAGQSQPE